MAIVIEEEKSGTGLVSILLWLIVLACIVVGAYYVFFKRVDIIDIDQPSSFQETMQLSGVNLHPELVVSRIQQPAFTSHSTIIPAKTNGRSNPFLGL
jgi:hypothetical protein